MVDLIDLAQEQAERTQAGCDDWLVVLNNAKSCLANSSFGAGALRSLADASASPRQFQIMADALAAHNSSDSDDKRDGWPLLVENVDDSPYTLKEWLEAWEFFHHWLQNRNRPTSFFNMLSYLACCGQYLEGKAVYPAFIVLLEEMLEGYGFEDGETAGS